MRSWWEQPLGKTLELQCQNRATTPFSGKKRVVCNMHVFAVCQIDVLNKQLVSLLSWNNLLSETSLGESYIITIYRHLDVNEKHLLDAEGVYNIQSHIENNFLEVYTHFFNSIFKGTLMPVLITINNNTLLIYLFTWNIIHLLHEWVWFPSHENNAPTTLRFNTSQKKLAFYEIFVYRMLVW